jgi:hypothetical protein
MRVNLPNSYFLTNSLQEELFSMHLMRQTFLLFSLNLLDAVLTIFWVRHGVAIESNQLMANLLEIGNFPFLAVKLAMGAVTAIVILYWGDRRIARLGMTLAISVYLGLMGVHIFTGLSAFGLLSSNQLHDFASWAGQLLASFV